MSRRTFFILATGFWLAVAGCQEHAASIGGFDPQNVDQVVDIYVRSNYYKDFKLFESYGLKGKAGLAYTDAILYYSGDTVRWQRFLAKVQDRRSALAGEYSTAAAAPEEGSP